ncbi:MFS transporter [Rossellomorea vietnamensis]|uniref:MFS transporter n=1 Tax=Rossellomorea vietnamensis TaxID=218284 RepID=A0A5D4MJI2_9BACI|nr:MFS transporter [Rossellomorea vietnamensis]
MTLLNKNNLLLFGLGISTFGDFIYLVAINILVLQLTGSAAAVAGLWIIGPAASLLTKFWSGSIVDRMNKRKLMIGTDIARALLVALIPFCESVYLIYVVLFFLSLSKAFFEPASIAYITALVPEADRKRFNSFRSLITSGAFLVGPAISGVLILFASVEASIWINSVSFLISAVMLNALPDVEAELERTKITLGVLREDWRVVYLFSRKHGYIAAIYFLSQFFMVIALGMDAQEVVFTRKILLLTEAEYGFLISITGIGSIVGASVVSALSAKLSVKVLMSSGFLLVSAGYLFYAFSFSFWSVAAGFLILGFFNPFWGTGFMTFYQNNVPLDLMGRFTSLFGMLQSILQIVFIMLIGFTGELFPLRYSIITASILMLLISVVLIGLISTPSKSSFYVEEGEKSIDQ